MTWSVSISLLFYSPECGVLTKQPSLRLARFPLSAKNKTQQQQNNYRIASKENFFPFRFTHTLDRPGSPFHLTSHSLSLLVPTIQLGFSFPNLPDLLFKNNA